MRTKRCGLLICTMRIDLVAYTLRYDVRAVFDSLGVASKKVVWFRPLDHTARTLAASHSYCQFRDTAQSRIDSVTRPCCCGFGLFQDDAYGVTSGHSDAAHIGIYCP